MASISEYEQQQFWNNLMNEAQKAFIENKYKEEFKSSFYDQIIFGESYMHIDKDCVRRIHPLSEEAETIKNKLNGK